MNRTDTTKRPGLLVAIILPHDIIQTPREDDERPYSSQSTEESAGLSPDYNNRRNEHQEHPEIESDEDMRDIDDLEENKSAHQPEISEDDQPQPETDEDNANTDREIDSVDIDPPTPRRIDRIDRDPIVQPGTNPMKRDNSQII